MFSDVYNCHTLLLWRDFIWPHLDAHDNHAIGHMFEHCGKNVRRFTLSDHLTLFELSTMLDCCKQIVQLHLLRSTKLHPKELGRIVDQMKNLQHLDILWTSNEHDILWTGGCDIASLIDISSNLKELTIRTSSNRHCIHTFCEVSPSRWIEEWVYQDFLPQRLNIVTNIGLFVADVIEKCLECNGISPEDYTSTLKIYNNCKNPVNCLSTLPIF